MVNFIKLLFQKILCCGLYLFVIQYSCADSLHLSIFPLTNYPQQASMWFKSQPSNQRLLSEKYQEERLIQLKQGYFGTAVTDKSPWAIEYMQQCLKGDIKGVIHSSSEDGKPKNFFQQQQDAITSFTNHTNNQSSNIINTNDPHTGYGINYLPYSIKWSTQIADNMNLEQFNHLVYNKSRRAIATANVAARVIPTNDPWFLSYKIAGEGYPFDCIQESKIDIGTPLYIVASTKDKLWSLVVTPYITAWVETTGIATVDDTFIKTWQKHMQVGLVVITKPDTGIINIKNIVHGVAYIGAIFPLQRILSFGYEVLVPIRNNMSGQASVTIVQFTQNDATLMPLPATVQNFMLLIDRLHGRPYSWGGQHNYNDCSAEIQNIFIPLGYFMPRNSEQQLQAGTVIDLSDKVSQDRQDYLIKYGRPLLTLI